MNAPLLNRIRMVTLRVQNVSNSATWYQDRLGLKVLWHKSGTACIQPNKEHSTVIMLVESPDPSRFEKEMILSFTTPDIGIAHQTLKIANAEVEAIQNCGSVSAFCLKDPAGSPAMIWSPLSLIEQRDEVGELLIRFVPVLI